jgi:hypothetical protein
MGDFTAEQIKAVIAPTPTQTPTQTADASAKQRSGPARRTSRSAIARI